MARAAESVLGRSEITGVPYNTDAGALAAAGVPVVVFGPGDIAQAHTPTEFVEIAQVSAAAEIRMCPRATASRAVAGFAPTSTIRMRPRSST